MRGPPLAAMLRAMSLLLRFHPRNHYSPRRLLFVAALAPLSLLLLQAVPADTGACAGVRKREVVGALGGLLAGVLLVLVVSGDLPLAQLLTPLGARPLPQLAVPHAIPAPVPSPAGAQFCEQEGQPTERRLSCWAHVTSRASPFLQRSARARRLRRQPCAASRRCAAVATAAYGIVAAAAAVASCSCPRAVSSRGRSAAAAGASAAV